MPPLTWASHWGVADKAAHLFPHLLGQSPFSQPIIEVLVILGIFERYHWPGTAANCVAGLDAQDLSDLCPGFLQPAHLRTGRSQHEMASPQVR
jgi:hypothetical protein